MAATGLASILVATRATRVVAQDQAPPALVFEAGTERLAFSPADIWAVEVRQGARPGAVNLEILLNGDAKDRFARYTAVHVGQPLVVYVGGEFVMEAILQVAIASGRLALGFPDQPSAAAAMDMLLGR